jgi:hypothetical protein
MDDHLPIIGARYKFSLPMTRIMGSYIISSKINFIIGYVLSEEHEMDDIIMGWTRIEEWLEDMTHAMVFSSENDSAMGAVYDLEDNCLRFSNPIMLLPTDPGEDVLGFVIQAKFNALADGAISFDYMTISPDEANGVEIEIIGNGNLLLPSLEDWMGEGNYFDEPWWNRNDATSFDTPTTSPDDKKTKPEWASDYEHLKNKPAPSGVIIQGRFKPKLIGDE